MRYSEYSNIELAGITTIVVPNTIARIEDSVVHPKLVYFNDGWNGYKYWLAITPYPSDPEEFPCMFVSNDLQTWAAPVGATNPITNVTTYPRPRDPDLVYDPIGDRLLYYFGSNTTHVGNFLTITTDGINWTTPIALTFDGVEGGGTLAILRDSDGIYICYQINVSTRTGLDRHTSEDGYTFISDSACTVSNNHHLFWHHKVWKEGDTYYIIASDYYPPSNGGINQYLLTSLDGFIWTCSNYPIIDKYLTCKNGYIATVVKDGTNYIVINNEWDDYDNKFYLTLFKNILLPYTEKPNISLSLVPTLPYICGDDFIRNDAVTLGTSKSGHTWASYSAWNGISSNKSYAVSASNNCFTYIDCGKSNNIIIEGRFFGNDTGGSGKFGIFFRGQDSTHYFYFAINLPNAGDYHQNCYLKYRNGGSEGTLISYASDDITWNDIIGVKIVDDTFTFIINGREIATYSNPTYAAQFNTCTKHGIVMTNSASNTLHSYCDYFSIRNV